MKKITQVQVGLVLLVVVLLGGFFVFGFPPKFAKLQTPATQQQAQTKNQAATPVMSISGKVNVVDTKDASFSMVSAQNNQTYTVKIGTDTKLVRLVFPFDLKNPPKSGTFTPERKIVALSDMKAGDQMFVRSSAAITSQTITNPIEVQILP